MNELIPGKHDPEGLERIEDYHVVTGNGVVRLVLWRNRETGVEERTLEATSVHLNKADLERSIEGLPDTRFSLGKSDFEVWKAAIETIQQD